MIKAKDVETNQIAPDHVFVIGYTQYVKVRKQ